MRTRIGMLLACCVVVTASASVEAQTVARQNAWSKFGVGSWVILRYQGGNVKYVIMATTNEAVEVAQFVEIDGRFVDKGVSDRKYYKPSSNILDGISDGSCVLQPIYTGPAPAPKKMASDGAVLQPVIDSPLQNSIESHEILQIAGKDVKCSVFSVVPKKLDERLEFGPSTITVWQNSEIKLPFCQSFVGNALPPGVVKFGTATAVPGGGIRTSGVVEDLDRKVLIGNRELKCAVVKWTYTMEGKGRSTGSETLMWLSDQVPGGLVKCHVAGIGSTAPRDDIELVDYHLQAK